MANVVVLGAGNIGGTLSRKWAQSGHTLTVGVRNPSEEFAARLATDLGDNGRVTRVDELETMISAADAVVFAIPGSSMDEIVTKYAAALNGRVVIDAANRMGSNPINSLAAFRATCPDASYFRAFNTLGWENFAEPRFDGVAADLLYCGPGGEPGALAEQLISDIGLRPVSLGDSDQADLVDSITALWFALAIRRQHGRHLAFKVLGV